MTGLLPDLGFTLAALPYSKPPSLELGPLSFHLFGFLVGTAIISGTVVASPAPAVGRTPPTRRNHAQARRA